MKTITAPITKSADDETVLRWMEDCTRLCRPGHIRLRDGAEAEKRWPIEECLAAGELQELNQKKYLHPSHSDDVSPAEKPTYILIHTRDEAGPANNWMASDDAHRRLPAVFDGFEPSLPEGLKLEKRELEHRLSK